MCTCNFAVCLYLSASSVCWEKKLGCCDVVSSHYQHRIQESDSVQFQFPSGRSLIACITFSSGLFRFPIQMEESLGNMDNLRMFPLGMHLFN